MANFLAVVQTVITTVWELHVLFAPVSISAHLQSIVTVRTNTLQLLTAKRKRSPSFEEITAFKNESKPTARTTKVRRRGQGEAFKGHWDGISEIVRDLI